MQLTVAPDMLDCYRALDQRARDQFAAMTAAGVLFTAHERDRVLAHTVHQSLDARLESRTGSQFIVEYRAARIIEFLSTRHSTQFAPHKNILKIGFNQALAQAIAVEVLGVCGKWIRANICHYINSIAIQ